MSNESSDDGYVNVNGYNRNTIPNMREQGGLPAAVPLEDDIILPWGRQARGARWTPLAAGVLTFGCPLWTILNYIALEYFDGSLSGAFAAILSPGLSRFLPRGNCDVAICYGLFIVFQAAMYMQLDSPRAFGQRTPAGHLLEYRVNGWRAWFVTVNLTIGLALLGHGAWIAENWEALLVAANTYGLVLSTYCWLKAYASPSYADDRKFSGSNLYDFFCGIELNPRIGETFDLKFFHISRPSMISWTLVNISFAVKQHNEFGNVTKSMLLVNLFSLIYCIDFFRSEDWYVRTIDISHDHFGFYLAWGSTVLLPTIYTLQAQYLARYPTHLSNLQAAIILLLGITGYAIFRSANHQKDIGRRTEGRTTIFGKPATYLKATYRTEDGKSHKSILLTCGWWGIARHSNYTADLLLSFAACAPCGFTHLLPWTYLFFMTAILVHREIRDEQRCARKYGEVWKTYCSIVKWRMIPGLF